MTYFTRKKIIIQLLPAKTMQYRTQWILIITHGLIIKSANSLVEVMIALTVTLL
jgi:hypothetical protein